MSVTLDRVTVIDTGNRDSRYFHAQITSSDSFSQNILGGGKISFRVHVQILNKFFTEI